MNAAELRKDALEETFEDVELLIYNIIHRFRGAYELDNIPFDDCVSVAFLAFVQAYDTFDFNKGLDFSTWLSFKVRFTLQNYCGTVRRQGGFSKRPQDYGSKEYQSDSLAFILADLDDDARTIINLIFDTPKELMEMITEFGGKIRYVKNVLIDYLLERGWQFEKIIIAFTQIEKALA